ASGVLGTSVREAFVNARHEVLGLSHTRSGGGLVQLDLTKETEVEELLTDFKPNWVIHCAAERRPDVAEKDPEGTRIATKCASARTSGFSIEKVVLYPGLYLNWFDRQLQSDFHDDHSQISIDYVFDGTSPPYIPSSPTNPLQSYGQSKRDGELAVLAVNEASVIVLRVPVLHVSDLSLDSSHINQSFFQDQSGKVYKMDHYATRYPTNVLDIAQFLVRLSGYKKSIPPILHYSAAEPYTKYEICLVLSKILNLPHEHIVPDAQSPTGSGAPTRPRDCQLYTRETEELHIGENEDASLGLSLFEEWWTTHLKGK
ncbi:hypothetical protein C0989_011644, partial [Termitomyces sp. Mn162]